MAGLNQAWWDERAGLHGQDRVYDTAGFRAGASTLRDIELQAVGPITGQHLVHLQCHTGMDTLSWLRHGAAQVTGVDFSPVAIGVAQQTATATGLSDRARFVTTDVLDVPADLHGRFHVCFASFGVLCWINDVRAWMHTAAAVLRPGGRLVLIDFHPLYQMADSLDPLHLDFPYAYAGPRRFTATGSYALPDADTTANETEEYAHSLGEIVTAAVAAGLRIDRLDEYLALDRDGRGVLTQADDGRYRWRHSGQDLPVAYGLRAHRAT